MIDLVTKAMVDHLTRATADLGAWIDTEAIDSDAKDPVVNTLYVVLYGINEHGHLRNLPLEETDAGLVRPPVFLRLSYLMAYFSETHLEVQRRLARVVETFHTTPILHAEELDPLLAERVASLTVRLHSPTLEERNQLWTAMGRALRLAVYYEVDVAPVPLTQREGHGRIAELDVQYEIA
jgi:uncharacterized protein DUF4255